MDIIFGVIVTLVILLFIYHYRQRKSDPPGPIGLPIIGSLPWMKTSAFEDIFRKCGKQYGDLFSVQIGTQKFVILNSYDLIREAYLDNWEVFSDRPDGPFYQVKDCNHGVSFTNGHKWRTHRRFTLRVLRDFGLGKSSSQDKIMEEVEFIDSFLCENVGKPVVTTDVFVKGVANIICILVFGERFGYSDASFDDYVKKVRTISEDSAVINFISMIFPWLFNSYCSGIINTIIKFSPILTAHAELSEIIRIKFLEHKTKCMLINEPIDLLESYIHEQAKLAGKGEDHTFDDKQCIRTCFDLFLAGTDTVTFILGWAMIMLSIHGDVQERLHEELDRVVGSERRPQLSDKKNLPYLQAFMDEIHRFRKVNLFGIERKATKNTVFHGYLIESTSIIYPNIEGVHRDPSLWKEPDMFKPERFLTDLNEYRPIKYLIPFSMSKRGCLGQSLAQMEYFLFLASVMQRYSVRLNDESLSRIDIILRETENFVLSPDEFNLIFEKRVA